ncbi:MAG TPA: GAF domain-containing protein [Candidatus Sulfotelmatobacter sp.]|nr:GAF domain-containing protein [Candidatus Sulfotelmatobacter sp.]
MARALRRPGGPAAAPGPGGAPRPRVQGEAAVLRRALAAVDSIAAEMARTHRLPELLPAVLRTAVEAVGADAGIIRLLDRDRTSLLLASSLGVPEGLLQSRGPLPVDETTVTGRAIRTGEIQAVATDADLPGVSLPFRDAGLTAIVCAPLVADGWPVGTVSFASRAPGRFGVHEHHLLSTVAHHLATAVVRAQLLDAVARGKTEWERLFDTMADGVALCEPGGRIQRVNRAFAEIFGTDVRTLAGSPCPLDTPHEPEGEVGREIDGPRPGQRLQVNTLPLHRDQGGAGGVMHVVHDVTAERTVVQALRRQNMLLEEARAEAELFGEIAHSIAASLRLEDVLDRIVDAGRRFAGVDGCAIKLPDPEGRSLTGTAMSGGLSSTYRESHTALDQPYPSSLAWRERRTVVVEDYDASPQFRRDIADRFKIRSGMYVPLLGPVGPLGVMIFSHMERARPFSPEAIRRAERLAAHAAVAIENAHLHRELAEHAARLEARVRERTEALERASRHKSDFLAHMSHELRTPLNGILGFSAMLLEGHGGPLTEKGRRYAGQVQQSGQHLLALINDVLDLSKVEAGRLEVRRESVAVAGAVATAVDLTRGLAAARGVTVAVEAADPSLTVRADPVRLHQAITNLLSNAIKFTPGGGRVSVRVTRAGRGEAGRNGGRGSQPDRERIEIAVADTGIGIDPQDLERLFQPFEQLENRVRRSHEGTGLGLALTRRLVELHGGSIRAESPGLGQGSTFTLSLPLDGCPTRRTVAVVEDDAGMRELLVETLRAAGHRTLEAATAAEAAPLLGAGPDLLILDLVLPDRPGQQILADLRAHPATRELPVLAISGSTRATAGELRAAGADEFLTKPFSTAVLLDAVNRLLGQAGRGSRRGG